MNCPNCGAKINQGEMFCRVCGTKIISQSIQQNSMTQANESQQNHTQNQYNMQQPHMNNTTYNNYSNDDTLINAYIGKNAFKLKNGSFSFNTFFFGTIYVLYRKMWLLGIIWVLASMIISLFLPTFSGILSIVANIIISTQFKKWYLEHVKENIAKIKSENPTASHEQLLTICTQKGGTTIAPIIILVILYLAIFIINFFTIYNTIKETRNLSNSTDNGDIGNLTLNIPSTMKASEYNDDSYISYSLYDINDYCRLTITTANASYYNSINSYLENNVYYSSSDVASNIEQKNINNNNWAYMSIQKSYGEMIYYYVGQKNDKIYDIEFSITNDSGVCSSIYSNVINSLKFN